MTVTVIITVFGLMVMVIRQRCERRSCSVLPSLSSDPGFFTRLLGLTFCGGRRGRGLLRDQGRLQLERWLLFPVDGGNVFACLHFMDIIVFVITVVVITVRLSRQVLVVRLLMFVLFVMCIIMIMCVLHISIIMSMFVVMTCRCTSSWTGSSSLLGAPCGLLFCVCMVGVRLVVWMTMAMAVTMAMAFLSG